MARVINQEKIAQVKGDIINATMNLILKEGFLKVTLTKVAKEVNMTKAGLYWYFESKEELLNALCDTLRITFIDFAKSIENLPINPREKIEYLFESLENEEVLERSILLMKIFLELIGTNDEIKSLVIAGYAEFTNVIESIVDEAKKTGEIKVNIPSRDIAKILIAFLDGCIIHDKILGEVSIKVNEYKYLFMSFLFE